jgi:soluble lytic murein transglycosylase-like protein
MIWEILLFLIIFNKPWQGGEALVAGSRGFINLSLDKYQGLELNVVQRPEKPVKIASAKIMSTPAKKPEAVKPEESQSFLTRSAPNTSSLEYLEPIIEKYAKQYHVSKEVMIKIAKCESNFRPEAVNGPYGGMYQFVTGTWVSNRNAMGENPDPGLRFDAEEAIKTTAFKISRDGTGAWPVCSQ